MMIRSTLTAAAALMLVASAAEAAVITQFNFNSLTPDNDVATGSVLPSTGAGTISVIGNVTATFGNGDSNGGSTDPVTGDDSGYQTTSYPAQSTNSGTAGIRVNASTLGVTDVIITFDQRHSNTSSRFTQLQYSTDGVNFVTTGLANNGVFIGDAGDTWFNNRTANLSAIDAVENNPLFAFRVVSIYDPATLASTPAYVAASATATYAGGTLRYDQVTVNGTVVPEPTALGLLGLGGLAMLRRKRA